MSSHLLYAASRREVISLLLLLACSFCGGRAHCIGGGCCAGSNAWFLSLASGGACCASSNAWFMSLASRSLASRLQGKGGGPVDLARCRGEGPRMSGGWIGGEAAETSGGWIGPSGSPLLRFSAGGPVHGLPATGPVPASDRGLSATAGPSGSGPRPSGTGLAQLPRKGGGADAGRSGFSAVVGLAPSAYGAPGQMMPVLTRAPSVFSWKTGPR